MKLSEDTRDIQRENQRLQDQLTIRDNLVWEQLSL